MNPQDGEQQMARFAMGQRLGSCLVRGCVALVGTIQALGPVEQEAGEPDAQRAMMTRSVDIQVQEWLYRPGGDPGSPLGAAEKVRVTHAAPPAMTKTSLGPWQAWQGARLDVGGPLLVLRWAGQAARASWRGKPEDVALAVSDAALQASLREAIAQHRRFERDASEITTAAALLRDKPDALFAGYLLTCVMDAEGVRDVDKAAPLLAGLLGHAALPGPARTLAADWLASSFYRLSPATRKSVTEALVVSASGEDAAIAQAALGALVKLGDQHLLDMRTWLTPMRLRKVTEHYRSGRAQRPAEAAHPEFEAQLGLR